MSDSSFENIKSVKIIVTDKVWIKAGNPRAQPMTVVSIEEEYAFCFDPNKKQKAGVDNKPSKHLLSTLTKNDPTLLPISTSTLLMKK
jgi:hypothetical protein